MKDETDHQPLNGQSDDGLRIYRGFRQCSRFAPEKRLRKRRLDGSRYSPRSPGR